MHLTGLDWVIVVLSIVVSFIPAIVLARRAGRALPSSSPPDGPLRGG